MVVTGHLSALGPLSGVLEVVVVVTGHLSALGPLSGVVRESRVRRFCAKKKIVKPTKINGFFTFRPYPGSTKENLTWGIRF